MEIYSIICLICMTFFYQIFNNSNHIIYIISASRIIISSEDVEQVHILVICFDVIVNKPHPIDIHLVTPIDDFIINVREILDIVNIITACFKPSVYQIKCKIASSMS